MITKHERALGRIFAKFFGGSKKPVFRETLDGGLAMDAGLAGFQFTKEFRTYGFDGPPMSLKRYAMISDDFLTWHMVEATLGDWVKYDDVIVWRDTLETIKTRLLSTTIADPLGLVRLVDKALKEDV